MMNEKLKQRTRTGILFGIVVLGLVLWNANTAALLLFLVGGLAGGELLRIANKSKKLGLFYIVAFIVLGILVYFFRGLNMSAIQTLISLSIVVNVFLIITIYTNTNLTQIGTGMPLFMLYICLPICLMIWHIWNNIDYSIHSNILLLILLFIWSSDSFAYLIGSKIGKTKLFKRVSPNKTWEGSIGAGICTLILGFALSYYFELSTMHTVLISLVCWIFGSYGDLYQSLVKRQYQIKDSGDILPGHGGFYDRFDSFIFVLPFVLGILYFC